MRKELEIDWEEVARLLSHHCKGTEIAALMGMCAETLYARVNQKYNMTFGEYSKKMKGKGVALIRDKQFQKALAGDNTMLVWIGKNYMSQSDQGIKSNISVNNLTELAAMIARGEICQKDSEDQVIVVAKNKDD